MHFYRFGCMLNTDLFIWHNIIICECLEQDLFLTDQDKMQLT